MANPLPFTFGKRAVVAASIAVVTSLTLLMSLTSPADASKSLVTVFADGEERAISTNVLTVGEALERAGIELGNHDIVEPGIDTFINESSFRINVYRAKPITIVDGDTQATVMSPYDSPRLIAESAGITVYPEDGFHFELISDIIDSGTIGQRLVIDRATNIKLAVYGEVVGHRTHADTVGAVLGEVGITPGESDSVNKPLDAKIKEDITIAIVRTGTDVISENVAVEHEIKQIFDSNMFSGQTKVKTPGYNGTDLVTYEIELENGIEVARREISRVTKKEPITEVQIVGTKVADTNSNVAIGQEMAARRGWTDNQWQCLYSLWMKESRWNHTAANPSSGAYGIPQALPGDKMGTVAADWRTNPSTQIAWGLGYIAGRYGSPCGAWNHSVENNWY